MPKRGGSCDVERRAPSLSLPFLFHLWTTVCALSFLTMEVTELSFNAKIWSLNCFSLVISERSSRHRYMSDKVSRHPPPWFRQRLNYTFSILDFFYSLGFQGVFTCLVACAANPLYSTAIDDYFRYPAHRWQWKRIIIEAFQQIRIFFFLCLGFFICLDLG